MRWWIGYWKQNLLRSIRVWERGQAVSALVGLGVSAAIALLSTLGLASISDVAFQNRLPVGLLIGFLFLLLVITPMRMWKENTDTIQKLTTRQLKVFRKPPDPGKHGVWLSLEVKNESGIPARRCYGKVLRYRALSKLDESHRLPGVGLRLPWSWFANRSEPYINISPWDSEFLDIAMSHSEESEVYLTPTPAAGAVYEPILKFALPRGNYEVDLLVGSEVEGFPPTVVRVNIRFDGGLQLDCDITEMERDAAAGASPGDPGHTDSSGSSDPL